MKIVVDPPKRVANLEKLKLDLKTVDVDFFEHAVILPAKKNRFIALGLLDGKGVAVVFKPVGTEALSVISLRPAGVKERRLL